ncbi:MAG: hypothetical protein Q8K96_01560 [Rubrivivax sp.]|nr:hypothetical protein [Rubrivivax sp.]
MNPLPHHPTDAADGIDKPGDWLDDLLHAQAARTRPADAGFSTTVLRALPPSVPPRGAAAAGRARGPGAGRHAGWPAAQAGAGCSRHRG